MFINCSLSFQLLTNTAQLQALTLSSLDCLSSDPPAFQPNLPPAASDGVFYHHIPLTTGAHHPQSTQIETCPPLFFLHSLTSLIMLILMILTLETLFVTFF